MDSALQSPADKTQRIHAGDEVVQVNKQTVVSQESLKKKFHIMGNILIGFLAVDRHEDR